MNRVFPFSRRLRQALCLCLAAVVATACHDAASKAAISITTQETVPSLEVLTEYQTLPDLVAALPALQERDRIVQTWEEAWEHWNLTRLRHQARTDFLREVQKLPAEEGRQALVEALRGLQWLKNTELIRGAAERVATQFVQARRSLLEAESALAGGYTQTAMSYYLEAADKVYAVSARGTARRLVWQSEAALELWEQRGDAGVGPAPGELERARRLVSGARRALDEGDYARSIQRAHYAGQILQALTLNVDGDVAAG